MNKRLLVVDDEAANLFAYRKLFMQTGMEVDTAETVEEAGAMLEQNEYCLVLTDIRFNSVGDEGGFAIMEMTKKLQPRSRVIMITAYGDKSTEQRAYRLGADLYLEKPVPFAVLRGKLVELGLIEDAIQAAAMGRKKSVKGQAQ
ncbi:MAG: response regulator [Pseudomonadota bacterium]